MRPISAQKRSDILALLDEGLSTRKIAAKVGVSNFTANKVRNEMRPDTTTSNGGRPRVISSQQRRAIVREIISGRSSTASEVHHRLPEAQRTQTSVETVRNVLREAGLKCVHKKKKPKLTPHHMKLRLEFARKYSSWTVNDWKRVIWSDETKINRLGSDGRKHCWKKPGGQLQSHHVQETIKFGGGSLMIWGCMLYQGVGWMCRIDGRMDANLYTEILADYVKQSAQYYGLNLDDMVFQQDNDSKHTSKQAQKWLSDNDVKVLDWPSQSPDLNPIEHLWDHLKRRLNDYEEQPTSMHELWQRVEAEWNKIPAEVCGRLIESMPRRIEAVLKAKGGHTDY